ncbi:hypothetical protein [Rugamonas apoptosis]|uniref:Uncharacterized protein n=1 Tax=Rugamonas apoptosis TaxID=2758570 RepID=A0A7W2F643_9BURK|nr:hypothetical protein [Rugamonas apoptosis]MBA5685806.1 hypothetical protein [Rugamonas apoptosis]
MFDIAQQCTQAGNALLAAQLAALRAYAEAMLDGGMLCAERHADVYRTTLATGTVAARQIMWAPVDPVC